MKVVNSYVVVVRVHVRLVDSSSDSERSEKGAIFFLSRGCANIVPQHVQVVAASLRVRCYDCVPILFSSPGLRDAVELRNFLRVLLFADLTCQ